MNRFLTIIVSAVAVKELQTDLGVDADGRFGPDTAAAFNEAVVSGELSGRRHAASPIGGGREQ
jgi:hypothetical protein